MTQVVIENPVLNSPFVEPRRHFKFTEDGITDEIVEERRISQYFVPIPRPKKKSAKQLSFETEWTADCVEENKDINKIRERVALWRKGGYIGITKITASLLEYWKRPDRERKLFFCQIEALETAIWIGEVAGKYGEAWIENLLREKNQLSNPLLYRIAFKMATGSGKTLVIAMIIAWQTLNKLANKQDPRFSDTFLIVTPGITIRDRLRVLLPNDPQNYYRLHDLVPSDLMPELDKAKMVITNFHAFKQRERISAGKLTKQLLKQQKESPFTETPDQMVRRVCREFGNKKNIIVINDEAHHCYRCKPDGEEEALSGDERREAEQREEEARIWISGIEAVKAKLGVKVVYDLSATPFFLRGSGTTAYVAEQWGRRWITLDTSRVAIALARTRLMSARYSYYMLADSREGQKKEAEFNPINAFDGETSTQNANGDLRKGFVYERVPHVTLKSIANNGEIDEIHAKYQPELDKLRAEINKLAKQKWEEWEIPREAPSGAQYPSRAQYAQHRSADIAPLQKYWELRCERQKEIDASIARRADTEFLCDKPYQDNKRIRVAGPFTVESLSPHRVLTTDDLATSFKEDALNTQDFTQMILENLKTAGVQNTIKHQRLKFDRLEPYAGTWIHAVGEYTEKEGKPKRAAISIGPELGTVSPEQVKEAAKEAVQGVGFDLLIVCGFAFDPHVSEESKRYGNLTILPTHMNPDLAMGDELLKKTGAGNLFTVFGEPDLDIKQKDGKVTVYLKGLDVYDPTTGEIRSNTTDDIACWFIDTDYNGESFIVRHAYFTGADEPYDKLKRALRAEIDESAWSAVYSTTSYPFEKPSKGKIAVKVINHYGDEVLKVYDV